MTSKYAPIHQAFAEQIEFFRQKLNLPTEVWDDIERAAHDRAFVVAGAQGADLLYDLRGAVDKAIEQGTGLAQFRKDFAQIVAKHGWTGWTGEGTKAGVAWRTKVIYQTNMATSYAAGRWKQLNDPELLKIMPYWQYHHNDSVLHPRPLHKLWDGLTLPPDHPFFKTHFPPGGWGCLCWVSAVTKEKYMLAIANGKGKPPEGWDAVDPKTSAPVGIDKGFDYAPGAGVDTPLRQVVQDKLVTYPPAITRALSHDVNRYINAEQGVENFAREVIRDKQRKESLWLGFVENFEQVQKVTQENVKGYLVLLPAENVRHAYNEHLLDSDGKRPLVDQDFAQASIVLTEPDTMKQGDAVFGGGKALLVSKSIGGEIFNCVFDILHGKKNRALAFRTLFVNGVGGR